MTPSMTAYLKRYQRYIPLIIALVTLAVFSPVAWDDFVNLDDPIIVTANPHIRSGVTLDSIRWAFTSQCVSNWVPVTMISHMLDVQLFGMHPSGHHMVNLLLHAASSVLFYLFLNRATGKPFRSATAALLYALHPLQVESVAWIAERKDVLSAFFWMLTIYAYLFYCEGRSATRYLTVVGLFIMAMLSKPMTVTLPVVLLLLDWWPLGRCAAEQPGAGTRFRHCGKLLIEKVPLFALSAAVSVVTYLVKEGEGEIVTDFTLPERLLRAFVSYAGYLWKVVWPDRLAVYYPVPVALPSSASVTFSFLLVILISLAVVLLARRDCGYLVTGWFWFIVTLLPVIGLIQSGACLIADRYTYVPLAGLFMAMVWGGAEVAARRRLPPVAEGVISVAAAGVLIALTTRQLQYWQDTLTLLSHAIEVTEDNWLALNNLGQEYLNRGKIDEALWYFSESVRAKPTYVIALVNLAALHAVKNQPDLAVPFLARALKLEPRNEKALTLLLALQASGVPGAVRLREEQQGGGHDVVAR